MYGSASTQTINISTTGSDSIETTYNNITTLSTSYGAWMFTNDGVGSWFLIDNYTNTLSTLNRNILVPFSPSSINLTVIDSTFTTTWTASANATSYSISYYYTLIPQTTGGTLIQSISVGTATRHILTYSAAANYYYYAILTTTNVNGSSTISSALVTPTLTLLPPTNVSILFSPTTLTCVWTPVVNASSYILNIYQTPTQTTINAVLYQNVTSITVPFYVVNSITIDGYYYYATVQAVTTGDSSPVGISPFSLSTLTPSATSSAIIYLVGINSMCVWVAAKNATSYIVQFYQNATSTTSGGTLIETDTATGINQMSSAILVNGTYIYATVTSVNPYGSSSVVTSATATNAVANPPQSSTKVTMTLVGLNTVATWTAAVNALSYTVLFYQTTTPVPSGGTLFETDVTASLTQTTSTILINGYYYYATVQSSNSYGISSVAVASNQLTRITNPPQQPTNVSIAVSGINLLCTWTAAVNAVTYTVVFYQNNSNTTSGGSVFETDSTTTTSQPSSNILVNAKYYYATVTSVNTYGSSSTITTSGTSGQITNPPPGPPSSVSISVVGFNLQANWLAGVNALSYTVLFYRVASSITTSGTLFETDIGQTGTSQTSSTLLLNGYYYYCTVQSINPYGSSAVITSATPTNIVGVPPQAVSNISLSYSRVGGTTNTVTVSWTAGLNATSYTIAYYQVLTSITSGGTLIKTNTNIATTVDSNTINIIGGYYYYAIVTSVNGFGSSASLTSSLAIQATTAASQVTNVSITISGVYASSSWTASADTLTYTVQYYQVATATTTGGTLFETQTLIAGTSNTSINVLVNGYYYYATITSVNAYANSSPVTSSSTTVIAQLVPLPTASVSVNFSGTQVTATWTASVNATSYTILFYQNQTNTTSGGTLFQTFTGTVGTSQLTSNTLLNGYYYYATVTSIDAFGSSSAVTSASTTVAITGILPSPPTSISMSVSTYYAVASWTGGLYNVVTYTIQFYQNTSATTTGGTLFETRTGQVSTSQTTSNALLNDTYYYYAIVTSVNSYGSSSSVVSINVTTPTANPPLPPSIVTMSFSGTQVTANWAASTNASSYTIIFYQNSTNTTSGGTSFQTFSGVTGTSQLTSNTLLNSYYYYATVQAFGQYGNSTVRTSSATTVAITGILPSPPTNISMSVSTYYAVATWTAGLYNVVSYTILFYQNTTATTSGGTLFETDVGQVSTSQTTSAVLLNNSYYYATVTSVNSYGSSSTILSINTTTPTANPPLATTSVNISLSGNKASVSWNASVNTTSYTVVIYNPTSNVTTGGTILETDTGLTGTSTLSVNTLTSGQYYYATVTCVNSYGSSPTTTSSSAMLASILPTGGAITINSLISTSGSITITAAAQATSYTVYISTTTSSANSVYSFITTVTGSSVNFTPSPSLTTGATYYAVLLPTNTYGNGSFSNSSAAVVALYTYSGTLTFTPAGATGPNGPILSQCVSAYSSYGSWVSNTAYFNMQIQGRQEWTAPSSRNYTITCAGAAGGNGSQSGGTGFVQTATFFINQGSILIINVGQVGGNGSTSGGGGGLSNIYINNAGSLSFLMSSGGGGGGSSRGGSSLCNAVQTVSGQPGYSGGVVQTNGGTAEGGGSKAIKGGGGGAGCSDNSGGAGGGGYNPGGFTSNSNGGNSTNSATGGKDTQSGYVGGTNSQTGTPGGAGGFGGGGAGSSQGGGGGGGYCGGGGGCITYCGGGGGSYIGNLNYPGNNIPASTLTPTSTGANGGDGYIQIT